MIAVVAFNGPVCDVRYAMLVVRIPPSTIQRSLASRPTSNVHHPPSTVYRLPSTIHSPPSTAYRPRNTIHLSLSTFHHPPPAVQSPPSIVHRPPSPVLRPPSTARRLPSTVHRPPSAAYRLRPRAKEAGRPLPGLLPDDDVSDCYSRAVTPHMPAYGSIWQRLAARGLLSLIPQNG